MVQYSDNKEKAYCDGIVFCLDKKTGYYLASKPTYQGQRERLHRYVYRTYIGSIPKSYHVHHKNSDKTNNEPDNLVVLTASEHLGYHGANISEERLRQKRKNLEINVRPKASEWHRSEVGREWHKKHGIEVAKNLQPKKYICQQCGEEFHKKPQGVNKFCSNNCKSAYRRKSGVDNIERKCESCGKTFIANKYSTKKYCSQECRKQHRRISHDQ